MTTKKKTKKTKKFTVTVKDEATTQAPAVATTTQASADATTQAPQQDSSADASGDSLKKVELSTTSPKVGDVINAVLTPASAKDVSSYTWYVGGKEVSGNATSSYTVVADDLGKTIKVVVTTKDGSKIESNTSAAVIEDNTTKATIVDKSGFQADGTALVGDFLDLEFGDGNGIPEQITWYVNNKLQSTKNSKGGSLDDITFDTGAKGVTGNCYAIIKNEDGTTFKTPVVSIVDVECPATLSDVSIDEDYSTNGNVTIDTKSEKYVVTVSLNRDYAGKFYLIDSTKTEIKADNCSTTTGELVAEKGVAGLTKSTIKNTTDALTVKGTLDDAHKALKFVNSTTNKVTYMFKVQSALTRGTSYKVVFDQAKVDADDIKTANTRANVSSAVTAAYVKAPKLVKVTSVKPDITAATQGVTAPTAIATIYADASGDSVADYLSTSATGSVSGGSNVTNLTLKYFADTNYDGKGGKEFETHSNLITKGVDAADDTKADSNTDVVTVYATLTGIAGIFGKDALTLTSEAKVVPITEPGTISISNVVGSKDAIKVTIGGQLCDGTIYLVGGKELTNWDGVAYSTPADNTAAAALSAENGAAYADLDAFHADCTATNSLKFLLKKFNPSTESTYISKAFVPKTAGSYTFTNVIKGINSKENETVGDLYAAIFVPNSEQYITVNTAANKSINLKSVATTWSVGNIEAKKDTSNVVTSNEVKLIVKDQFGTTMKNFTTELASNTNQMRKSTDMTTDEVNPVLKISNIVAGVGGVVTVSIAASKTVKASDSWEFSTNYGTFTLSVSDLGADGSTGAAGTASNATFKLTFKAK